MLSSGTALRRYRYHFGNGIPCGSKLTHYRRSPRRPRPVFKGPDSPALLPRLAAQGGCFSGAVAGRVLGLPPSLPRTRPKGWVTRARTRIVFPALATQGRRTRMVADRNVGFPPLLRKDGAPTSLLVELCA